MNAFVSSVLQDFGMKSGCSPLELLLKHGSIAKKEKPPIKKIETDTGDEIFCSDWTRFGTCPDASCVNKEGHRIFPSQLDIKKLREMANSSPPEAEADFSASEDDNDSFLHAARIEEDIKPKIDAKREAVNSDNEDSDAESVATVNEDKNEKKFFLSLVKQMKTISSSSKTSTSGGMKAWTKKQMNIYLTLCSPDPANPIKTPPANSKKFLNQSTIAKMMDVLESEYAHLDFTGDMALCKRLKNGNFKIQTKVHINGPVKGFSIFSCLPESESSMENRESAQELFDHIDMNIAIGAAMSQEKIKQLSTQSFGYPTAHMQMQSQLENTAQFGNLIFDDKSHASTQLGKVTDAIMRYRVIVGDLFEKHGAAFSFSLFNQIHVEFALFVDAIIDDPTTVCKEDLDYSRLIRSLKDGTFMNCYSMSFNTRTPKEDRPVNGKRQLNTDRDANATKKKKVTNTNSGTQSDVNFARLCGARSRLASAGVHGPSISGNSACHKWFYKGVCDDKCGRKRTHVKVEGADLVKIKDYKQKLETEIGRAHV